MKRYVVVIVVTVAVIYSIYMLNQRCRTASNDEEDKQNLRKLTSMLKALLERLPQPSPPARDCLGIALTGASKSGPYVIIPEDTLGPINVYCYFDIYDTVWTVFQRRFDGSVDFERGWKDYEDGFGTPDSEYWMGLKHIHRLVKDGKWNLRVSVGTYAFFDFNVEYDSFYLTDSSLNYSLSVGSSSYRGNVKANLITNNNVPFSTYDRDNDDWEDGNCAAKSQSAWWYRGSGGVCEQCLLNGIYSKPEEGSLCFRGGIMVNPGMMINNPQAAPYSRPKCGFTWGDHHNLAKSSYFLATSSSTGHK